MSCVRMSARLCWPHAPHRTLSEALVLRTLHFPSVFIVCAFDECSNEEQSNLTYKNSLVWLQNHINQHWHCSCFHTRLEQRPNEDACVYCRCVIRHATTSWSRCTSSKTCAATAALVSQQLNWVVVFTNAAATVIVTSDRLWNANTQGLVKSFEGFPGERNGRY